MRGIAALAAIVLIAAPLGADPADAQSGQPAERPKMRDLMNAIPGARTVDPKRPNVVRFDLDIANYPQMVRDSLKSSGGTSAKDIRDFVSNRTRLTYDRFHGPQAEYTSKDGKVFLWYPGNQVILPGAWKADQRFIEYVESGRVTKRVEQSVLCFRYGANTYNPATGHAGDGWQCQPFAGFRQRTVEAEVGDVLNLKRRDATVPFVLEKDPTSIANLRARAGE